jgi:hypothetical protein
MKNNSFSNNCVKYIYSVTILPLQTNAVTSHPEALQWVGRLQSVTFPALMLAQQWNEGTHNEYSILHITAMQTMTMKVQVLTVVMPRQLVNSY